LIPRRSAARHVPDIDAKDLTAYLQDRPKIGFVEIPSLEQEREAGCLGQGV
jgi:hypothetical protein